MTSQLNRLTLDSQQAAIDTDCTVTVGKQSLTRQPHLCKNLSKPMSQLTYNYIHSLHCDLKKTSYVYDTI